MNISTSHPSDISVPTAGEINFYLFDRAARKGPIKETNYSTYGGRRVIKNEVVYAASDTLVRGEMTWCRSMQTMGTLPQMTCIV